MKETNLFLDHGVNHIGIIMDGNGRWAKRRSLPRSVGHERGGKTFREISNFCIDNGLKILTVYAFSTENWSRPKEEVEGLMNLLREYFKELLDDRGGYIEKNTRIIVIGDLKKLENDIRKSAEELMEETKNMTGMTLNIAINYGGRGEILNAFKVLHRDVLKNNIEINNIDEEMLSSYMYTKNQDDPDIIIRTGGNFRTSNFLIWQSAYSEYMITKTLWPDYRKKELIKMIKNFAKTERRFGGI